MIVDADRAERAREKRFLRLPSTIIETGAERDKSI
jgi:hypothetical protein